MEGNTLFNPGFLGGNFNWWIGQIPDEDTWRENITPRVYSDPESVKGWGCRYKVRIMGVHEWGEEAIPSEQLPWAQVMYPVTAGGGQAEAFATPALRQGNMVFGFFMDQQEQQIPVIMGVLGNNAQIPKSRNHSSNEVTNEKEGSINQSGFKKAPGSLDAQVPDTGRPLVSDKQGSIESPAAMHQQTVDSKKKLAEQKIKHPILNPHDVPGSAMSSIQTALDNLINYVDGWVSTITSYAEAAGAIISTLEDMEGMLKKIACEIAKYLKIIMDKVMEYTLKVLNKALAPVVSAIPSNMRYMFGDIKEMITELICCLYNKMTAGMCDLIANLLMDAFDLESLKEKAEEAKRNAEEEGKRTLPQVPVCYAEDLVGKVIASKKQSIDEANNSILNNINSFVTGIQEEMAGLTDDFADIVSLPGDIAGSIGSALSFNNFVLNIFGCELSPQWTSAEYWSIGQGGSSHSESEKASPQAVGEASNQSASTFPVRQTPFLQPDWKTTADVDFGTA